jgi:hypothetical protein
VCDRACVAACQRGKGTDSSTVGVSVVPGRRTPRSSCFSYRLLAMYT